MKKRFIKIVALIAATVCCMPLVTACKTNKTPDSDQFLEIYVLNVGYGYEWAGELAEAFGKLDWVKEKYPNFDYTVKRNDDWDYAEEQIESGPTVNTADIMFGSNLQKLYNASYGGNPVLTDLDDIMKENVLGENVKYEDKIFEDYLKTNTNPDTGKVIAVPWGSTYNTLLYNETLLSQLGFTEIPVTTDELVNILKGVKDKNGAAPYAHTYALTGCYEANYWKNAFVLWWAQYQGIEGYTNFYNGVSEGRRSKDIFKQEGRLKSLEAMDEMLNGHNGYMNPSAGVYSFMEAQTNFLMGDGLFYMCGDWFDYEMRAISPGLKSTYDYEIRAMRMPVISSLRNKTAIESDEKFAEVIRAVDGGATGFDGVSAKDFALIKNARALNDFGGGLLNAVIPAYATAKDLAKDFLRYLATDDANAIFTGTTKGANLGFKYDVKTKAPDVYAQMSLVERDKYEVLTQSNLRFLPAAEAFPLAYKGGLIPLKAIEYNSYESVFGRTDDGRKSASDLYEYDITYYDDTRWNLLLSLSGI